MGGLMGDFRKILIANRGEIACRIHDAASSMGYRTVAVYSDADRQARHVDRCNEAVRIGPAPVAESYLNIAAILEAARKSGADAVHPGYGFLSENAEFADACEEAGLVFIGPPVSAIAAMGNKAAAKRRMIEAGVPCVPGYQGADQSDDTLARKAREIGWPVMVKAAAGGGGRGMRLVSGEGELLDAIRTARTEAESAFGSGELILERAVVDARHVEIQVFADAHGHVIHLGERDCSVQRRHQKVIEEAPSPAVNADLRQRMGGAAVAAAKAVGYRGAGTVEFLLGADGAFYFLEMNTRLQVEHPVTELALGIDLVRWQIQVARGEALPLSQGEVKFIGHAIEVRLYAEDPYADFLPQTGRVHIWKPAFGTGVRFDYGVCSGDTISAFYDPMIAKVIGYGETREHARQRLIEALSTTVLLGPTTNRHYLIRLLEHPEFVAGKATTAFIGKHSFPAPEVSERHWQMAAQLLWQESAARYPASLRGWRNSNPEPTPVRLATGDKECVINVSAGPEETVPFHVDGDDVFVDLDTLIVRFTDKTYVPPAPAAAGSDGKLRAPMDGRIVAIKVASGDRVVRGQTLVVLEAMKIQHQIKAGVDARIEAIAVQEGQQVANRTVLVTLAAAAAAAD
jgi:geranyl-CoA carboxylase alpha subunit